MARDFRNLVAWRNADELAVEVYRSTATGFPPYEKFGLVAQMREAAVSVAANIAEGSGRQTDADFRRFLFIAQGSLSEVEYYLHLASRLGFMDAASSTEVRRWRAAAGRTLTGLIRATYKGRRHRFGETEGASEQS